MCTGATLRVSLLESWQEGQHPFPRSLPMDQGKMRQLGDFLWLLSVLSVPSCSAMHGPAGRVGLFRFQAGNCTS